MKTEPGLAAVKTEHGDRELDKAAILKLSHDDWLKMGMERQGRALEHFEHRRRGRDKGGVVVIEDSDDDDALPPPVRVGDAGQGSTRDDRVKEEKPDDDNGGDDGNYSAFSQFLFLIRHIM